MTKKRRFRFSLVLLHLFGKMDVEWESEDTDVIKDSQSDKAGRPPIDCSEK